MGKILSKDIENIINSFKKEELKNALLVYYNIKNLTFKSLLLLVEQKVISYEDILLYLNYFEESSFYNFSKEELENIRKIKNIKRNISAFKKEKEKELKYKETLEKIIEHINSLLNKNYKAKTYSSMILPFLKKGYTLKDFRNVHYYFLYKWGLNSKMVQYLRPKTLYNNKFEERVNESNSFWEKLIKYKKEINKVINVFSGLESLYLEKLTGVKKEKEINIKKTTYFNITTIVEFVKDIEKRNIIVHWLENGYNVEDITFTISVYFEKYGTQKEIFPHITLEKILDEKFPKRVEGAKKIKLLANSVYENKTNEEENVLNQWLNKNKKNKGN